MNPNETNDRSNPAMQKFGFEAVRLDQPGAPTPGRIADRLGDITTALEEAVAKGDLGAISNGVAELMILALLPSVLVKVIDPTIMEKAMIQSDGLSPMPTRTCVLLGWLD